MGWQTLPGVQRLLASVLSTAITELRPLYARTTATQNLMQSNTTLENITELVLTPSINTSYQLLGCFLYASGTTADIQFGFTFPAGVSMDYSSMGLGPTAAADTEMQSINQVAYTSGLGKQYGGRGTAVVRLVMYSAVFIMGSTAGSLQAQAAQVTSTAETETVRAGSTMMLLKVG